MNLPVKIYMKRYNTHNKTHWTTVYKLLDLRFILILYLVQQKNQVPYFLLNKRCDWLKPNTSAEGKKTKQNKKKNR